MGFRFRKSVKMGPVRLNFSSRGVGASVGVKGARVGVNSRGVYTSASALGFATGPQYVAGGARSRPASTRSLAAIEHMADEAEREQAYDALVLQLTSVHREADADLVRWADIADAVGPPPPPHLSTYEDAALTRLVGYRPGWLARLLGFEERRRAALEKAVEEGARFDAEGHAERMAAYNAAQADRDTQKDRARSVIAGDIDAWKTVVSDLGAFGTIGSLGSEVVFRFVRDADSGPERTRVGATVRVHSATVIPDYTVGRTPTGRLSTKKLSKTDFHALHQDYVCGCALRIARETLNLLPVAAVVVTCTDEAFDPATGHEAERTLLSVRATRRELDGVNLAACDPSDALSLMEHRMSFHKTQGFRPVAAFDL